MTTPPPITLRPLNADDLPALQALYERSLAYFRTHAGGPPAPDHAAWVYRDVLEREDRHLLGIWWERTTLVGCLDLRFDHPQPGIVWLGALILADETPSDREEIAAWAVRILEEWLRIGPGMSEIRLALPLSDRAEVRFWTQMGYRATGQMTRAPIGALRERLAVYARKVTMDDGR
ncbi:MAG: hypothetical protein NZP34_11000 [Caldilineales bacterium]|nr:hypothetical protein [Caldilineales bacterium]MCX7851970.1 hypothetical protein [Caldilineales bacterium]